jgi:DNA-binding CsgD family transcriptional regulator/tetratricopeptide (TPR) repeat protein
MRKALTYIILTCILATVWTGCRRDEAVRSAKLSELDAMLERKDAFDADKEARISALRTEYLGETGDSGRFELSRELYEQYQAYQFDSASAYAGRMRVLAGALGDREAVARADMAQVFCLISAGFFKEAFDQAEKIDCSHLSAARRRERLELLVRLNYDAANFNYVQPYNISYLEQGHRYSCELLEMLGKGSADWHYYHANMLMKAGRFSESIAEFEPLAEAQSLGIQKKAVVTSCLSWMYHLTGDDAKSIDYGAEAAICDIQASTKETTALRMIADFLSQKGEIDRPARYVRESFEDATFYQARMRMIETGLVLPIIEQNRYDDLRMQRNFLLAVVGLVVLLVVIAAVILAYIREQNRKLNEARKLIEQRNAELEKSNALLVEANGIKAEYIGTSFYINAGFIEKMSNFNKMVERLLVTRQYDLLKRSVKEISISETRDRMYESFDSTFLKIFPTFINDYNALFDEPQESAQEGSLTTEQRIFALIRLGITETDRIAMFLNYSPHTINTYKTRVKNRSWVENDRFEAEIMKIGTR